MLNILLVSIAAPPKSDPESLQVGRYMKYLTQAGCSIELVTTANPTLYMEPDEALKKYNTAKKVHEHSLFEFRYLNAFINRYLPALNQYPDPKWSFRFFEIDQFSKPDIIYSRSYPISSTLLALKFKKQFNVPWILHLSDPWAFSYEGDSPATNFKTFPRRWNKKKESECFELADRISLTSVKTVDVYKKAYPKYAHKFLLTPNVFDEETISRSPVSFSDKLLILYTGGFGQKRSPSFFLQSICDLLDNNPALGMKIHFVFTGPMTNENRMIFTRYKRPALEHLGLIPYDQMIKLQQRSHVLVNIDSDIRSSEHSIFFPSKLLEYFAANRRVLNISNNHSVSWEIVDQASGDNVEFGDSGKLKTTLLTYVHRFNSQESKFFTQSNQMKQYEAGYNAKILAAQMTDLFNSTTRADEAIQQ